MAGLAGGGAVAAADAVGDDDLGLDDLGVVTLGSAGDEDVGLSLDGWAAFAAPVRAGNPAQPGTPSSVRSRQLTVLSFHSYLSFSVSLKSKILQTN